MQRLLSGLLALVLCSPVTRAEEPPQVKASPAAEALESLTRTYVAAQNKFLEQVNASAAAARKSGSPPKPVTYDDGPGPLFSPRFLALAEQNLGGTVGFQAIISAINSSGGPASKGGTWSKAMTLLTDHYATKPEIKPLLRPLGSSNDEDAENLLRAVMAKNPDRKLQALACKSLADGRDLIGNMIDQLDQNPALKQSFESVRGKEYVAKLIAGAAERRKEAVALRKMLEEQYADVVADVSVGKPAPEIVLKDIDGKEAKLSALKGKVVVLDIWATWCQPCRAMIPHERAMVERLKDKPFALVSISADAKLETLKEFLSNEKMPWAHWWNGNEGGVIDDWNIQAFPTIYVIDAQGIIRFKDVRDEKLEEAVNELLKDGEQRKGS